METKITYSDRVMRVYDIFDSRGLLVARRVVFLDPCGAVEKEYHRVYNGGIELRYYRAEEDDEE
jgi:hypothetical protein